MRLVDVPMPPQIATLPRDHTGRPVPWFTAWIDGAPDFRVVDPTKQFDAHRFGLCWICGGRRGRYGSFVIGPMCGLNRVSAEPPSHQDCATYAARACPFLATPNIRRRPPPEGTAKPAGEMIERNPGVTLVWSSRTWRRFVLRGEGALWNIGDQTSVEWYTQGRPATRAEIIESIDTGLPLLREIAERDGERAVRQLGEQRTAVLELLPAESSTA